jgi:hypothetical protein
MAGGPKKAGRREAIPAVAALPAKDKEDDRGR